MSSPSVTTVLLPPAKGEALAAMVSAHLAGNVLAGQPPRQNWGKFEAHKWGGFTARSQPQHRTGLLAWRLRRLITCNAPAYGSWIRLDNPRFRRP